MSANKAQEQKLQEMNEARDVMVAELQQRIQSLEKELDNANELLSDSKQRGQRPRLLNPAFLMAHFHRRVWVGSICKGAAALSHTRL